MEPPTPLAGDPPTQGAVDTDEEQRRDRGVVLVWFALSVTVLVGMAGFATDLAYWYLTASRAQNAADAAALGGVVFMPSDFTQARAVASTIAVNHGYTSATVGIGTKPNQLEVIATKDVDTFFVKVFGIKKVTVSRRAVAEYEQPVAMGSPDSNLGNDPDENVLPQYWLNIAGPESDKSNGDRYATKRCGVSGANENCSSATTPRNAEYTNDGYLFGVKATAGQPLRIQLWDAAYVPVGDVCNQGTWPSASQLTNLKAWYGSDADSRYASGNTKWCSGDQSLGSGQIIARTTVLVRAPDNTPWMDTDNTIISSCTQNFPGYDTSTSYYRMLHPSDGHHDAQAVRNAGDGVWTFAETFRQWATVCDIPAAAGGDYIVQIRTNASAANAAVYDSSVTYGGHNRFAMRVGAPKSGNKVDGAGYVAYARGRLPIYANNGGTNFKAARVLPGAVNRTLRLKLFDIGDASGSGTLYITPSPDANISTFSGCTFSRSDGASLPGANTSTCSVSGVVSSSFNGKIVTVEIPIPDTFDCDELDENGCWVNIYPDFTASTPTDTTTWSADMLGSPVRLVE